VAGGFDVGPALWWTAGAGLNRPWRAAIVIPLSGDRFIVASMYAPREKPHRSTGSSGIYADGTVHRLISRELTEGGGGWTK